MTNFNEWLIRREQYELSLEIDAVLAEWNWPSFKINTGKISSDLKDAQTALTPAAKAVKDVAANVAGKVTQATADASDAATNAMGAIKAAGSATETILQKLHQYTTQALPDYINSFAHWLVSGGKGFIAGAIATKCIGYGLTWLAKKINKEAGENTETMKRMLSPQIKSQIDAIENLKQTNPDEYNKKAFEINKTALSALKASLQRSGVRLDGGLLVSSLNLVGKSLNTTVGTLFGACALLYLATLLGFNPMPIFPKFGESVEIENMENKKEYYVV